MTMLNEMNETVKKFFSHLDTMLENDKDIGVNSTNELIKKVQEIIE